MNISEWGGNPGNASYKLMLSVSIPISFAVIVLAFLFANDIISRSTVVEIYELLLESTIIAVSTILGIFRSQNIEGWFSDKWWRFKRNNILPMKRSLLRHRDERRKKNTESRNKANRIEAAVLKELVKNKGNQGEKVSIMGDDEEKHQSEDEQELPDKFLQGIKERLKVKRKRKSRKGAGPRRQPEP
ncbi:hypothetical protein F5884DRAFT_549202 [Xylogone sp. PMI_703]|nr:hypothetical protein F5884DRAFT_549202 [Xylogone sp. PMI_703]